MASICSVLSGWFDFGNVYVPIRHASLTLDAPSTMPLIHRGFGAAPKPRIEQANGRQRIVYEARDIPRIDIPEPILAKSVQPIPYVRFTTATSWQEIAGAYDRKLFPRRSTKGCEAEVAALMPPSGPLKQRVAGLFKNLHRRVRYVGLELRENALLPHSPCETLRRGFGDCKDQSTLVMAALESAGIPSHLALLSASGGTDVEPDMPTLTEFNHAIVYIPGPEPMWLDPALTLGHAGDLDILAQGRRALVIGLEGGSLKQTPAPQSAQNTATFRRTLNLATYGNGEVIEAFMATGQIERDFRSWRMSEKAESTQKMLREYAKNAFGIEALLQLEESNPSDLDRPFASSLKGKGAKALGTDLMEGLASLTFVGLFDHIQVLLPEKQGEKARQFPMQLEVPVQSQIINDIEAPKGFVITRLPKAHQYRVGSFSLRIDVETRGSRRARITFSLDTGPGTFQPSEVMAITKAIEPEAADLTSTGHLAASRLARLQSPVTTLQPLPQAALPQ